MPHYRECKLGSMLKLMHWRQLWYTAVSDKHGILEAEHLHLEQEGAYTVLYDLPMQSCTLGNAFPPTISVLHRVESIFPRQSQLTGLHGWSPANSSPVYPFPFFLPVHHFFGSSILVK